MLQPAAHVPQMLCSDVVGLDGTKAAVDLPADLLDRCTIWIIGPAMAGVHLDLAGIDALQVLLADAAGRMRERLRELREQPAQAQGKTSIKSTA